MLSQLKLHKMLLCLLLAIVALTAVPTDGFAQPSGDKIDAILLVDVSKSMETSDKNKVSNEAMKMFVDMTSLKGNKIGVIAYTDKIEREKALVKVNSDRDKQEIKSFIDSLQKGPYTDIATGMSEAVKVLDDGHDPANAPIIVLLADGNNDLNPASGRTQQQSDQEMAAAIKTAQDKGYPIYTIGLNADGQLNKKVLQQIAADTSGKFFETSTADKLPEILSEIFANHLKLKLVNLKTLTANGAYQDVTVSVPNSNVLEANISLMSSKPVDMKLISPDGKDVSIPSAGVDLARSSAYSLLKLVQPKQGNWTLKVKGVAKDKIDINMIFNYDLQLAMEPLQAGKYKANDTISIKAALTSNGQKVTSPDLYKKMKATLQVKDLTSNQTQQIPVRNTGSGFVGSFSIPASHLYELKLKAEDSSFYRETQAVQVDATLAGVSSGQKQSGSSSATKQEKPWGLIAGGVLGALALTATALFAFSKWKQANKGFIGQVAIEIRDENTGEKTSPQYKKLNAFKGKVKLHQLLQLLPEYQETEKVLLLPGKNDTIIIKNQSSCTIEKSGRLLDATQGRELKKNDRIKISLTSVNKSIFVDYIV